MNESARRSVLLTGISYPLLVVGVFLLFTEITAAGAVSFASGIFLTGVNELCLYIAKNSSVKQDVLS